MKSGTVFSRRQGWLDMLRDVLPERELVPVIRARPWFFHVWRSQQVTALEAEGPQREQADHTQRHQHSKSSQSFPPRVY